MSYKHPSIQAKKVEKDFAITAKRLATKPEGYQIYLKSLIENLSSKDEVISGGSMQALLQLVQEKYIESNKLLEQLLDILPSTKNQSCFVQLVIELSLMDDNKRTALKENPLLKMLQCCPDTVSSVFIHLNMLALDDCDTGSLLKPLIVGMICQQNDFLNKCSVNDFISICKSQKSDEMQLLISKCLPYTMLPYKEVCKILSYIEINENLIFNLFAVCQSCNNEIEKKLMIKIIKKQNLSLHNVPVVLLLISGWIVKASPGFLSELLSYLDIILKLFNNDFNKEFELYLLSTKVALLSVLTYRKSIPYTNLSIKIKNLLLSLDSINFNKSGSILKTEIFNRNQNSPLYNDCLLKLLSITEALSTVQSSNLKVNSVGLLNHLLSLSQNDSFIETVCAIVSNALFFKTSLDENKFQEDFFDLLISKKMSHHSLITIPVFLNIIKATRNYDIIRRIVKSLPKLISFDNSRYVVAPLLKVALILSKSSKTQAISFKLLHGLFCYEPRIYPTLLKVLASTVGYCSREVLLVRCLIVCEISNSSQQITQTRGADMLKLIDKTISNHSNDKIVMTLCLDALYGLCNNEVLSLKDLWYNKIKPLMDINSDLVVQSLKLVSLAPLLLHPEQDAIMMNEVFKFVWLHAFSKSYKVKNAALTSLLNFDFFESFKNKHLPESIRPDVESDEDLSEMLEAHISGEVFIKLLENVQEQSKPAMKRFLFSVMKQELQSLPRDIKARAMASMKRKNLPKNNSLEKASTLFYNLYQKFRKDPNLRAPLASSIVSTFCVEKANKNVIKLMESLLTDVTIDIKSWDGVNNMAQLWASFMSKAYHQLHDFRNQEMERQKDEEGSLTSGLWARDKLFTALLNKSKETSNVQANCMLALSGLVQVIAAQKASNEECEGNLGYVSNERWTIQACDTIFSATQCGYQATSRVMSWCQYNAVSKVGDLSPSQMSRICAFYSSKTCIEILVRCDVTRVCSFVQRLNMFLKGEIMTNLPTNVHLHLSIVCGQVTGFLQRCRSKVTESLTNMLDSCASTISLKAKEKDKSDDSSDSEASSCDEEDEVSDMRLSYLISNCIMIFEQFQCADENYQEAALSDLEFLKDLVFNLGDYSTNTHKTLCNVFVIATIAGEYKFKCLHNFTNFLVDKVFFSLNFKFEFTA